MACAVARYFYLARCVMVLPFSRSTASLGVLIRRLSRKRQRVQSQTVRIHFDEGQSASLSEGINARLYGVIFGYGLRYEAISART